MSSAETKLQTAPCRAAFAVLLEQLKPGIQTPLGTAKAALNAALACAGRAPPPDGLRLRALSLVSYDLWRQGWRVDVEGDCVVFTRPTKLSAHAEKARIRAQLHIEREEQLSQPAVKAFISSMTRQRYSQSGFTSIKSLMRDGRDLRAKLEVALTQPTTQQRLTVLSSVIQPYIQVAEGNARCEHTGLVLKDVWRYFRHTWSMAYRSTPGRNLLVLIRDRAAPNHPVIGIGAVSSAAVQLKVRDQWIGWHQSSLDWDEREGEMPCFHRWPASSGELAIWVQATTDEAINEVYAEDLIAEQVLTRAQLRDPNDEVIARLRVESKRQRDLHNRFTAAREIKRAKLPDDADDAFWEEQAKTHLFRSKRAEHLSELLEVRAALRACWGDTPDALGFARLCATPAGRRTLQRVLRKAKAERVGVNIADINVCGAIPPYNELLGGKLVSALMVSPQVVAAYRDRYQNTPSIIASSMAGRRMVRPAELVFLGTTSLYGRSSQYNRLSVPCEVLGGQRGEALCFKPLGESKGYGTDHFSQATISVLEEVSAREHGQVRVNSLFGEGVNPKLRKLRDGIDLLGLDDNELLRHGSCRAVYGVPIARNFRRYLIGLDAAPDYLLPQANPAEVTEAIAAWWRTRWLFARVQRPETLDRVSTHRLIHPIRHGAFVGIPEDPERTSLFDVGWDLSEA